MSVVLVLAAVYNVLFGFIAICAPLVTLSGLGLESPSVREAALWQCIGMIVGVYGIAYFFASRAPMRHWPVVLAGLAGKILGPIGFSVSAFNGVLPWRMGIIVVFNDLVWWTPFLIILIAARRTHTGKRNQSQESSE